MKALRTGIAILVVAAVALTIGVGVMAATGGESRGETLEQRFDRSAVTGAPSVDPERRAELIRSQALNRRYGLGQFAPSVTRTIDPARRAELIRSQALNRRYGLGEFAPWPFNIRDPELRALMIRSDALNRQYKLGKYAPGK